MTGIFTGVLFGVGLFCIWWSWWPEPVRQRPARNTLADRLADEIRQAGVDNVTARSLLTTCLALAVVVGSFVTVICSVPAIGLSFAVMAAWSPIAAIRFRARRRRAALRDVWPDAVDNLTSAVRAGLSLPEALGQLSHRGPVELRPAFAAFAEDYRASGRFNDCLDRLKDSLADPVADRLIEALRIARDVGGSDLGRLLRTLSAFLREDARTRGELETRQSWTVNGARLAVAAPWIVLALLATRPQAVRAYDSAQGALVLAGGATCSVVAYRIMVRVGRLPEEARVLL